MKKPLEGLFNKPKSKFINAYNLDGELVSRPASNFRFRISVYGILVEEEGVLFHLNPHSEALSLPGGAVEIDENIETALVREFLEETGIHIKVGRQLIALEDFFTFQGDDAHSILLFYTVERKKGVDDQAIGTVSESAGIRHVRIAEIDKSNIQRIFRKALQQIALG